jgi:hypothetical protein
MLDTDSLTRVAILDGSPTDFQSRLAGFLGVDLSRDTCEVAAARLADAVLPATSPLQTPRVATERQVAFARDLGIVVDDDSATVCGAKIDAELRRRNLAALRLLNLQPGDTVRRTTYYTLNGERRSAVRDFIVSSIGRDMRVYFKGGSGEGAWPTQLERL